MGNTMTITDARSITLRLGTSTMAGWRWDGAALVHSTRQYLRFTGEKSAEIAAAVAAARPMAFERKSGGEVAALPESERADWEFDGVSGDVLGWYVKETRGVQREVAFGKADVVEQGRR